MTTSTTDAEAIAPYLMSTNAEAIARIIARAMLDNPTGGAGIERAQKRHAIAAEYASIAVAVSAFYESREGRTEPLYTAPPAPAGEVERLVKPIIDRLEWNGRLQQWVVRPDLPAGTIKAVRAALNGGLADD